MSSSIFGHLGASLHDYLDELIQRAPTSDDQAAANLGRFELPRIAAALQAVLGEHRPDSDGRCRTCRSRRLGRPTAPCRAYLTAYLCLLVTDDSIDENGHADGMDATVLRAHLRATVPDGHLGATG